MGREREIGQIKRDLETTRLLTLTGAGGSGKTRLALETARELADSYADGVWLVELAPLFEEELVPNAVAEVLAVAERDGEPPIDTLADAIGFKNMLLVLDNCEHLLEGTAELADALLIGCPRLRILATSREHLGVVGEVLRTLTPLTVPPTDGPLTAGELARYDAVRLFLDRVRLRLPDFDPMADDAAALAELCRRVGGMPLAVELAAARMRTLSIGQICERLSDSLGLLSGGLRTSPSRQRTMRATLDWSHDLLSEGEKNLFRRLSVFAGGWTLEAAEGVGAGVGVERGEILDLLSGLVDKSLVLAEGVDQGGMRYGLLEPIRQYAAEKLEQTKEAAGIKGEHAALFLALAERAKSESTGSRQGAWLGRLGTEHDNLRAALSWSLEGGDPELGIRLAAALSWFWSARGYFDEGESWYELALVRAEAADSGARAAVLYEYGWLLELRSDLERARACVEEALALYEELGNREHVAECLMILGWLAMHRGELTRAKALLEESLQAARGLASQGAIADSHVLFSVIYNGLGFVALENGEFDRAQTLWQDALAVTRERGEVWGTSGIVFNMGYAELIRGNLERATVLMEECLTLSRRLGLRVHEALALAGSGLAATLRGDPERGEALLQEGLAICHELRDLTGIAENLEGLAEAAGARRRHLRAASLWGAAAAVREVRPWSNAERMLHEPQLATARSMSEEAEWKTAFEQGKAMGLDEAVEYALSEEEHPTLASSTAPERSPSSTPGYPAGLSPREGEVLKLVASGMTSAQVAKELFLSRRTVSTHLTSIYRKLGVDSRAAAIRFALEHGLA